MNRGGRCSDKDDKNTNLQLLKGRFLKKRGKKQRDEMNQKGRTGGPPSPAPGTQSSCSSAVSYQSQCPGSEAAKGWRPTPLQHMCLPRRSSSGLLFHTEALRGQQGAKQV